MSKSPFEAYQLFQALKQHFTTEYDFHRYAGRVSASYKVFQKRPDVVRYQQLGKKPDLQNYILANLVSRKVRWVGDLFGEDAHDAYVQWRARNEAIDYRFREQLHFLNDDFQSNFVFTETDPPKLWRLIVEQAVWPETPVVLDRLLHFSSRWNKRMSDDPMWIQWRFFFHKYGAFVKCDEEKIKSLIISKFE